VTGLAGSADLQKEQADMSKVSWLRRGSLSPCAALAGFTLPAGAGTLDTVKQRGTLQCGVSEGVTGFSEKDAQGNWRGFDVDFCRAVAAAVLGDASKVAFTPLSASQRFDALKGGKVDLLARNSTWTLGREAELGPRLRRHHLSRRPGLPGEARAQGRYGALARQGEDLRRGRHHDAAQSRPISSRPTR
jgi:hypothetical protein